MYNPFTIVLVYFLAFLSCDEGLSVLSVRVYRAAVCTTMWLLAGPSFLDDPFLWDLVSSAALAVSKSPYRTISLDCSWVLLALRLPPYELTKECSLKHLTYKTTFLVSFAFSWRCIEVHALIGIPGAVAFESDGFMSFHLPEPGFPFPSYLCQVSLLCLSQWWRGPRALPCASCECLQEMDRVF